MGIIKALKCRECSKEYPPKFLYICEDCFGPLDVLYKFNGNITKQTFENRSDLTYWRYFEILPVEHKKNIVSLNGSITPLQKANNLGDQLGGLNNLFV
jgi:threonine synthase